MKFATAILVLMLLPIVTVAILSFTSAATSPSSCCPASACKLVQGHLVDAVRPRRGYGPPARGVADQPDAVGGATALVCLAVGLPAAYAPWFGMISSGKTLVDELVDPPRDLPRHRPRDRAA